VIDKYIVVVDMKGIATCYDSETGKEFWKERICGAISSSPFAADGLAYFQDEQGETVLVKPGAKLEILHRNSIGAKSEMFRASLTPYEGKLFARSNTALYCIAGDALAKAP
jgi:hypothetical protein